MPRRSRRWIADFQEVIWWKGWSFAPFRISSLAHLRPEIHLEKPCVNKQCWCIWLSAPAEQFHKIFSVELTFWMSPNLWEPSSWTIGWWKHQSWLNRGSQGSGRTTEIITHWEFILEPLPKGQHPIGSCLFDYCAKMHCLSLVLCNVTLNQSFFHFNLS